MSMILKNSFDLFFKTANKSTFGLLAVFHGLNGNMQKKLSKKLGAKEKRFLFDLREKVLISAAIIVTVFFRTIFGVQCPIRSILKIPCPGCGMTRALIFALRLDLQAAFLHHWMFWSIPLLYMFFLNNWHLMKTKIMDNVLLILIVSGFVAHWIYRIITF